jgi:UDP-GlcNAc:undecaprenyl-phosphate/decaprenyl-phosphate GlcNAc-1-phosphate transferase
VKFPEAAGSAVPAIIVAFVLAALISLFATQVVRRAIRRVGLLDHPDERRTHRRPLPRGGGLAVMVAFVAVGGMLAIVGSAIPGVPSTSGVDMGELVGLFGGGILAAVLGVVDDALDLRARWQFLGQIIVALVAVAAGITVDFIGNPFGSENIDFPTWFSIAFTVVWIVGMINSLNFIDGLDGLSTGISLIAAVTLGVLSMTTQIGQPFVAVLCFTFAGALLGFLRWNFYPAVIFQGTAGVMFLGYTLATLSILGTAKIIVALLVLAVPIVDSFWVIVRRLMSGRSPFNPDRGHIHHRLLDVGLSHRSTVLLIYLMCATLGLMSLVVPVSTGLLAFVAAVVGFGALVFVLGRRAGGMTNGESSETVNGQANPDEVRP